MNANCDQNAQDLLQDLLNAGVKKECLEDVVGAIIHLTYCVPEETANATLFRAKNWAHAYNTISQLKVEK